MTDRAKPAPYVLARTFNDAHVFARETLGLAHGRYRVCTSAGTIKSIRNCDLILAPGWERRFDGFTMRSAIRWTRMNVINWEERQAEAPAEPTPDGLEPNGYTPSLDADEATAFFATPEEPSAPAPVEQAEAPAGRRRSRCRNCGTLHFKEESCPPETMLGGS